MKTKILFFIATLCFTSCTHTPKRSPSNAKVDKPVPQSRDMKLGQAVFKIHKQHQIEKNQWALRDVSILKAWETLKSRFKKRTPDKCSVVVAVIDTGIHKDHKCLKNNLWLNKGEIKGNGIDDDGNGFIDDIHGWNFKDDIKIKNKNGKVVHKNGTDIEDDHGHGTHISGIISASGTDPKSPQCTIWGIAPKGTCIMTLKYFDETGKDNVENTIRAIKYAVNNNAHIINYSGGGPGANPKEKAIIQKAADKNIIFVAALGNDGKKINKNYKYYPASYELPNIIYVQNTNPQHDLTSSSNRIVIQSHADRDKKVQSAPGYEIISTLPPDPYARSTASKVDINNMAGKMTGTSQATAVATGVVALVTMLYPNWNMERVINQVIKTGYGRGTDKIKKITNQGKKLSAHKALVMKDQKVVQTDVIPVDEIKKRHRYHCAKNKNPSQPYTNPHSSPIPKILLEQGIQILSNKQVLFQNTQCEDVYIPSPKN